jgi:ethanolamine permease
VATLVVTVLYVVFVLAYAELACALPRAGGALVYARRAFGETGAALAGAAQWIEFVFAPPAIAAAIGAYVHVVLPPANPLVVAVAAYVAFTAVNVWGVRLSAAVEAVATVVAVAGLVLFAAVTAPHVRWSTFLADPPPGGWAGAFGAIPFAIWFYLGIEGLANVAEESRHPQRDLPRGFAAAMATLVVLTLLTLVCAVGSVGWRATVFAPGSDAPSDSPLPLALGALHGPEHFLPRLVAFVGLSGLVASFHGLLLAAGRATFELGRLGYLPARLGAVHPGRGTPAAALVVNMLAGIAAVLTGRTSEIIVISVFGALTMYAVSMASFFGLRVQEPHLPRPFRTPAGPVVAGLALVLSVLSLAALAVWGPRLALVSLAAIAAATLVFAASSRRNSRP